MEISIIIPVYNISNYIQRCLESVECQMTNECEVIIVDDGSSDDSYQIVEKFINNKNNYMLIHQKNGGLSAARNTGIRAAKGRYLLFLDGDDLLEKKAIQGLLKIIKNKEIDIIFNHYTELDESTGMMIEHEFFPNVIEGSPIKIYDYIVNKKAKWISAWNCMVRREFILKLNLYFKEGILHEDELWVPMIFMNALSVAINSNVVHLYRTNRVGSIMKTKNVKRELDKIDICKILTTIMDRKNQKIILRRTNNIMRSVLIEASTYEDREDLLKIKNKFKKEKDLLLNSEGFLLYGITEVCGFDFIVKGIRVLRKLRG